jgi:hypothetical protein
VQNLPSVFFTACYKILCSLHLDEAVLEEGAGISGLYLEGARWYKEQGRAYQVLSSLHVTKFFVLCV